MAAGDPGESQAQEEGTDLRRVLLPLQGLCALERDAPCSTFRANGPHGLVPPRQPALLLRDPGQEVALNDSLAQPAWLRDG